MALLLLTKIRGRNQMQNIKKIIHSYLPITAIAVGFVVAPFGTHAAPISYAQTAKSYLTPAYFPGEKNFLQSATFNNRQMVLNLFSTVEQTKEDKRTYLNLEFDSLFTLITELDIIRLFSQINRTITISGETILLHQFLNPLFHIKDLLPQQRFIQELVNNPELYRRIQEIVQRFKSIEINIIRLLDKKSSF